MSQSIPEFVQLNGKRSSFVLSLKQETPQVIYWGKRLGPNTQFDMLLTLSARQEVPGSPTTEAALGLSPTSGDGFTGYPGIKLFGQQDQWAVTFNLVDVSRQSDTHVDLVSLDQARQIELQHRVSMDPASDVVSIETVVTNLQSEPIHLEWCAAVTLPLPAQVNQILGFEGHWANEFQQHRIPLYFGSYVRENRRGRTSHDAFPGLIMHTQTCDQLQGEAYGFHLGWSGNHRLQAEKMADGRAYMQMGELLLPGEVRLSEKQSYQSPKMYASFSYKGLNGLSQQFHRFVRSNILNFDPVAQQRLVHYNTWEGIYFQHDVDTLKKLADKAASLGVERFVLDDGWFVGRNSDNAGLGDWYVDREIYPQGLTPVIEHVNNLGMEFGLWFEPEMVNPDSDLFRQHPDWVLSTPPNQDVGFRNQLVLDLTRHEVFDYLFERLDSLLSEYNIAYIKWDMNRDLNQPGNGNFKPAVHQQTLSLYRLLGKIKHAHPAIEIESCSSGGGRADFGVLAHTDRVWTSDSNDALDRLKIQHGFSYFFPAELMGSHVGPRDCHITHRHLSMSMRAAVALFGHMGMEMDLRELNETEQVELTAMVNLYKQHRELVHTGDLYRLPSSDYATAMGIVAGDKNQALFAYHLISSHVAGMPDSLRLAGLEPNKVYTLNVVWPLKTTENWPASSVFGFKTNLPKLDGQHYSGDVLMNSGIQIPRMTPNNSLIFYLTTE